MSVRIPELSLVVLMGASGCGKSTFARRHFKPTEILSSDYCRGLVSDDENSQAASKDAFDVLLYIAGKRLAAGRLTVIDATNVQPEARKPLVELAREFHVLPVAIAFNLPERVCHQRNKERPDRDFGPHVVHRQLDQLRRSLRGLQREGFRRVIVFESPEDVDSAEIARERLWTDRRDDRGPFDIIGDVHGCFDELVELLGRLGYTVEENRVTPPDSRKAVFLGDLVDRGPKIPAALRLVMGMVRAGTALCIPGNHDVKLVRALSGRDVKMAYGLDKSLEQLAQEPPEFREEVREFLDGLISHFVLDDGNLVVAHGGMKESMQGRASGAVRDFALYGETTGETDEFGLPVRYNWAQDYRGKAIVVYGHTPVVEPEWFNRTINIDTGCVFGGGLTALRYPERELVSVPARETYAEPIRPIGAPGGATGPSERGDILDVQDVLGRRVVETRLRSTVTIREENAAAAIEAMSRFAVDPHWLIYLPPTMSPSETSRRARLLEHPDEAFGYYRREGIRHIVCEEKHMGSRAIVIVLRDEEAARRKFRAHDRTLGIVYTRTGRRFFNDLATEQALLGRLRDALERAGLWDDLKTDWACLDCELMPWSAKAQELLREQYAPVGASSSAALDHVLAELAQSESEGRPTGLFDDFNSRWIMCGHYVGAYRRYCWPVNSLTDLKLAPFHLLATEGAVHADKDHLWHMTTISQICAAEDPNGAVMMTTPYKVVDFGDEASVDGGVHWWEELVKAGGEGMVVKPLHFTARSRSEIVQPALKCRGPEYLRIIYGPEYSAPKNLERLRNRSLGAKRSLALREFALGLEGLERFVAGEPLYRVHECIFGVLALESEPVDPRL